MKIGLFPAGPAHPVPCLGKGAVRWAGLLCALAIAGAASAQATDLIISEYVEGSSNNKYLELYNGTGASINLANYQLRRYSSGSSTPASVTLSGNLASGATIVYKNSSATAYAGTATVLSNISFNGDDAMALYKISPAGFVDIFGNIGCDPGSSWISGTLSTVNKTLVRNANICNGITTNPGGTCNTSAFPTLASQWTQYAQDDVTHLGGHTMTCGPTVNFTAPTGSALESAGTATVNLSFSPATTGTGTVTITIGVTGTATYTSDYTTTPAGPTTVTVSVPAFTASASFTINLVNDAITEPDETIDFTITGATGGISLGANLTHEFTIINDDFTPTVNFTVLNQTVLETAGTQTFNLSINPGAIAGNIIIQVVNGAGAVYGAANDYTSSPAVAGGFITVPVTTGQTTASFTTTVYNDGLIESTEDVYFTITSVPAGMLIGSNSNSRLEIGDVNSPPTVLNPGDLAVVGVNANDYACGGAIAEDQISFFCFKDITPGTEIILTDNGYEKCNPGGGTWGDNEGFIRMTRTGPAIPAGQVITLRAPNSAGPVVPYFMAPDNYWSCVNDGPNSCNMNSGGDECFFAQGGTWTDPGGANDATYSGTLLFAFSTNITYPWSESCGSDANNRSNLPPGVECFSMAPTSASDFNKYTGPLTAADQRDWIDRIDNEANWTSYTSCTDYYNEPGYDWLLAPTLPIIAGTMTPGLWRGAKSTDWFDCKNWDDARIPTASTDVVIDNPDALKNCEVGLATGLNPGGTGVCASLAQSSTASPPRNLFVRDGGTLDIGGALTIQNTSGSGLLYTSVLANSTLNTGSVSLNGSAPAATDAGLWAKYGGSTIHVAGNLTIGGGGLLDLYSGVPGSSGTMYIGGDFENQVDQFHFNETYGDVIFDGSGAQAVNNGGFAENFWDVKMDNSGSGLTLNQPIAVRDKLDLTLGLVHSSAAGLITLNNGGFVLNGNSNASFVDGPFKKIGATDFTFPIGKDPNYRPAKLSGITGSAAGAFTAEYFNGLTQSVIGAAHDATLDHVSNCEYWRIDRSGSGTPNAWVTLSWMDPVSCGVTLLSDLRVAYWDGTMWNDRGASGLTGTTAAGTVTTAAVQSSFTLPANYWTLASVSQENPLPIELLSFTAAPRGAEVALDWSTASEQDNAYFTVERSADTSHLEPLFQVPGAGNSQAIIHYGELDPSPLQGLSYYRLRQTDIDGSSTLSGIVPIYMDPHGDQPLTVLYGNDGTFLLHDFPAGSELDVLDLTGRVVAKMQIASEGLAKVPVDGLSRGVYVLRLTDASRSESTRFAY